MFSFENGILSRKYPTQVFEKRKSGLGKQKSFLGNEAISRSRSKWFMNEKPFSEIGLQRSRISMPPCRSKLPFSRAIMRSFVVKTTRASQHFETLASVGMPSQFNELSPKIATAFGSPC